MEGSEWFLLHSSSQEFIKSHFSEAAREIQAAKIIPRSCLDQLKCKTRNHKQLPTSAVNLCKLLALCNTGKGLFLPKVFVACFDTLSRQNT